MKTILSGFMLSLSVLSFADTVVPVVPEAGPYECYAIAKCYGGGVACYSVPPEKGGYYCKAVKYEGRGVECWTWDQNENLLKHESRSCF